MWLLQHIILTTGQDIFQYEYLKKSKEDDDYDYF